MRFENKGIVITGVGGMICSEFAKALADDSASGFVIPVDGVFSAYSGV